MVGKRRTLPLATLIDASGRKDSAEAAIVSRRPLFADGAWHEAPVYQREMLPLGAVFAGPAVVQQVDATTIIEPGWTARVDEIGNLRISAGVAA